MKKVADEYYKLIVEAKDSANSNEIKEIKTKLEKLLIPFLLSASEFHAKKIRSKENKEQSNKG